MNDANALDLLRSLNADEPLASRTEVEAARRLFLDRIHSSSGFGDKRVWSKRVLPLRSRRSARALALSSFLVLLLIGTAVAAIEQFSDPPVTVKHPSSFGEISHIDELEIFKTQSADPFQDSSDAAQIDQLVAASDPNSPTSQIDASTARSVSIPGIRANAWIFASSSDRICVFTPELDGFNSACGDVDMINKTGMFGIPYDSAAATRIAISIPPNGVSGLTVKSTDGTSKTIAPVNGVAVSQVNPTDVVSNGAVTVNLADVPTAQSSHTPEGP